MGGGRPVPVPGNGSPGRPEGEDAGGLVVVTRSGGIVGRTEQAEVRLGEDPRSPDVERLLSRVDLPGLAATTPSRPQPDRYVYTFTVGGRQVVLPEQDLPPELSELASLLLEG